MIIICYLKIGFDFNKGNSFCTVINFYFPEQKIQVKEISSQGYQPNVINHPVVLPIPRVNAVQTKYISKRNYIPVYL